MVDYYYNSGLWRSANSTTGITRPTSNQVYVGTWTAGDGVTYDGEKTTTWDSGLEAVEKEKKRLTLYNKRVKALSKHKKAELIVRLIDTQDNHQKSQNEVARKHEKLRQAETDFGYKILKAENEIQRLQNLVKKVTQKVAVGTSEVRIKIKRKEDDPLEEAESYTFIARGTRTEKSEGERDKESGTQTDST
jgi:hypothetical protein